LQVIPEDHYGVSRLPEVVIYAVEGISRQRNECRWLIVASLQGFCDGVKMSRRFFEHSESLLQVIADDYYDAPRLLEVFVCTMEVNQR
jgi:hypothetical protein